VKPGSKPPGSSRFRVTELPFAHFAVTDVAGGTFRHFQKSSRGAFGEAGFGIPSAQEPRIAWIEGWELRQESPGRFFLKASEAGRAVELVPRSAEGNLFCMATTGSVPKVPSRAMPPITIRSRDSGLREA